MRSMAAVLAVATIVLATASAADPPAGWTVRVVTKKGVRYDGVVMRTPKVEPIFAAKDGPDPAAVPADTRIPIRWFNGLNGDTAVHAGDVKSIEVSGTVDAADLKKREETVAAKKEDKWKAEAARLQIVEEERATRARAEADAAAAKAIEALTLPPIPADLKPWLDKFPPDQGWVPAKKDELYHTTVILNSRPMTEQEREWVDHYEEWKPAYDAWLAREQKKIELAAKQEAETPASAPASPAKPEPPAPGANKPEPSGTVVNPVSNVDPDHPTAAELALLPKRLPPNVPKPIGIDPKAPKPSNLDPKAKPPSLLENGERP